VLVIYRDGLLVREDPKVFLDPVKSIKKPIYLSSYSLDFFEPVYTFSVDVIKLTAFHKVV